MTGGKTKGFIKLEHEIVRSDWWAALSANATRLLIAIWAQYDGRNNGRLHYSVAQAVVLLHSSRSTALRTFAELRDAGLIEAVERGSFAHKGGARRGTSTAWRITFLR